MSEAALAHAAPGAEEPPVDAGAEDADEQELDEDASALLRELEESQVEVQRMLATQRDQAEELGTMKDSLASELHQLQDEAWKLQVFAELEMLKRQLAAINSLDADLDAMEAKLDADGDDVLSEEFAKELEGGLAAARAETAAMMAARAGTGSQARSGGAAATTSAAAGAGAAAAASQSEGGAGAGAGKEEKDEEKEEEEIGDVDALQDELDAELLAMQKQLQAIKAESALVAARKAQLELELAALIREGADDLAAQLKGIDMAGGEGEGAEAALVAEGGDVVAVVSREG